MRFASVRGLSSIVIICLIMVSGLLIPGFVYSPGVMAGGNWQAGILSENGDPVLKVLESNFDAISLNIRTEGFSHETIDAEGDTYTRVRIRGCGFLTEEGLPELPYIRKLIAVPECDGFDIKVSARRLEKLDDFNLYPAPRRETAPEGRLVEIFDRNLEAYSNDATLPAKRAEIIKVFYIRNQRVAEVYIYPITFNPVTRNAEFAREIELNITYKSPSGPVCVDNGLMGRVCENSLVNYGPEFGVFVTAPERPLLTTGPGNVAVCTSLSDAVANWTDYMIVVGHVLWEDTEAFNSIMQLALKRANFNGFNVSLIDVEDIADIDDDNDDREIKQWLYDLYHSRSAGNIPDGYLGYILLVGDAYDCDTPECDPANRTTILPPYSHGTFPSRDSDANDMPYASFDDEYDISPDVFIGRLSVDDAGETAGIVGKIVNYEPHAMTADPDPWYRKFLFIGGDGEGLDEDLHELGAEVEAEVPAPYLFESIYKDCKTPNKISTDINDMINAGVSIIVKAGHGMDYYWGAYTDYENDDCDETIMGVWNAPYYETLNNEGLYPIIYAFSCRTAAFDYPYIRPPYDICYPGEPDCPSPAFEDGEVDMYDCMAERLTVIPGRGSAGYIGFTRSAPIFDTPTTPDFAKELYRVQGMVGETVTNFFYDLVSSANQQKLIYIGDPALNPFFVEDQTNPSDDVDIAVVQDSWVVTDGIDQSVDIDVRIRNVGVSDAANIYIALSEGETLLGNVTIPYLGAYSEISVSMNIAVSGIGLHQYFLTVDPYENINELNPENNIGIIDLDYNPNFAVVPGSFARDREIFGVDGTNTLEVSVTNHGVLSAVDIPVELTEGEEVIWSGEIPELAAGDAVVVSMSIAPVVMGNHDYIFKVNPDLSVDETFLADNSDSISIAAMYIRDGFPVELYSGGILFSGELQYAVPTVFQAVDESNKRFLYKSGLISTSGDLILNGEVAGYYDRSYDIPIANVSAPDGRNIVGIFKAVPSGDRELKIFDSSDLQEISSISFVGLFESSAYRVDGEALAYDLDRDGMDEIIYIERNHSMVQPFEGMMKIFSYKDGDLVEIASHTFEETGGVGGYRPVEVTIEDIDFDNIPEIALIGYYMAIGYPLNPSHMIVDIFRYDSSLQQVRHENLQVDGLVFDLANTGADQISGNITLSDIDGDNYLDLVASLNDAIMTISGTDIENNAANLQKIGSENPVWTAVHCVDIDQAGNKELVMASSDQVRILSIDASWNLGVEQSHDVGDSIVSGPLVSDIDGDGHPEIIIGAVYNAGDENSYYKITILDHSLDPETLWEPVNLYGVFDGSLAIDDIDHEGSHEIILMARTEDKDGDLYVFGTPWMSGGEMLVPMEKGNNQHTNASKRYIRGTFGGNVTLCREVEVVGDLQIDQTGTLFVAPGAEIGVLDSDPLGGGASPDKIEISCYGGISINGLENLEASFRSIGSDAQASDWYGLILEENNFGGDISYCEISDAVIGIVGEATAAPISIYWGRFSGNQSGLNFSFCSPEIKYTEASNNTSAGITISGDANSAPEPLIEHCTIRNNAFNGMIFVYASGVMQYSVLEDNGIAGMLCLGENTCPEIANNIIVDNEEYGVQVLYDASPILGKYVRKTGVVTAGYNSIFDSPLSVFQDYSSTSTSIDAQYNYWGTRSVKTVQTLLSGNIVYRPILTQEPLSESRSEPIEPDVPTKISLSQNYPNPFKGGSTSISYTLPGGGAKVSLNIYDVAGRQVKTLVDAVQPAGSYFVNWDGLNNNGAKVTQGIYFYRLIAGEEKISRKMIFLR